MTGAVERVRAEVQRAVAGRVFPAAVAEVGNDCGVIWRQAFGSLTFDATSGVVGDDTIFDLASLTKPLATTSLVLELVGDGRTATRSRSRTCWSTPPGFPPASWIARLPVAGSSRTKSVHFSWSIPRAHGRSTATSVSSCLVFSQRTAAATDLTGSSIELSVS